MFLIKMCTTNLRHDYQVFCNFGSFILLSVIVFADLFKMVMIPNDSIGRYESRSFDYITNFF
jgi:hypothetical protein